VLDVFNGSIRRDLSHGPGKGQHPAPIIRLHARWCLLLHVHQHVFRQDRGNHPETADMSDEVYAQKPISILFPKKGTTTTVLACAGKVLIGIKKTGLSEQGMPRPKVTQSTPVYSTELGRGQAIARV
jgi:hypothetical protein